MAMTPSGRADAIYAKIAASANFSKLSSSEKDALKAQIQSIWGDGDLVYIQSNADVLPAASSATPGTGLINPAGQVVTIPSTSPPTTPSTGATSAPEPISGTGSIS